MTDERTTQEIARNYPPRKSTMVRRCTSPIIGEPDEWLFDEVTAELLAFLNTPGLTRDVLFSRRDQDRFMRQLPRYRGGKVVNGDDRRRATFRILIRERAEWWTAYLRRRNHAILARLHARATVAPKLCSLPGRP